MFSSLVTADAIAAAHTAYQQATPFPHVVLDGWFDESALTDLERHFARPGGWHQYEDHKRGLMDVGDVPLVTSCQSGEAYEVVRLITGVENLESDPTLRGGGLHAVAAGGRLGIHVDFNRHPALPLARRVNTLLYLNRTWQLNWQGALTLTNRRDSTRSVQPLWNRWVLFDYSPEAWHGHPEPLLCPPDVDRRALAVYYYTPLDASTAADMKFHTTVYADRPR